MHHKSVPDPNFPTNADSDSQIVLQEINIEQYRTQDLVDSIGDLISIPTFLVRVGKWMLFVVVFSWLAIPFLSWHIDLTWWIPLVIYGWVAAIAVGFATGITYGLARAFGDMLELLDLTLQVTDQVIHDFRSLASGEKKWPSPRQFVIVVYDFVIIPSVEKAFSRAFWFFGSFVVWSYKQTLGRIVRYMLKFTPAGELDDEDSTEISDDKSETDRHAWISTTREWTKTLGTRLKWTVLFPFVLLCTLVIAFGFGPILAGWLWLTF